MGDNFSNPSFDATSTAAYTFNDLISYWNEPGNTPQPGTEDYILYYYLTQPDAALGYPSIESLCTPDPTTGVIPDANITELQKEFQDTDSYATNVVSLLSNPNDSHYYWTNVTYSYSWSGNSAAVQSDINILILSGKGTMALGKVLMTPQEPNGALKISILFLIALPSMEQEVPIPISLKLCGTSLWKILREAGKQAILWPMFAVD